MKYYGNGVLGNFEQKVETEIPNMMYCRVPQNPPYPNKVILVENTVTKPIYGLRVVISAGKVISIDRR